MVGITLRLKVKCQQGVRKCGFIEGLSSAASSGLCSHHPFIRVQSSLLLSFWRALLFFSVIHFDPLSSLQLSTGYQKFWNGLSLNPGS